MGKSYIGTLEVPSFIVTETKPLDVRTVVDSVADLTNGSISNLYTGIVVNIKGTADLYVLVSATRQANRPESWVKVGGSLDPSVLSEYARKEDLINFLTASDVEDFVRIEDIDEKLDGFVAESDLDLYVKVEDIIDFVKESDLADYAKKEDLVDFLTSSDAEEFVRLDEISEIISEEFADKFVSQSDLDVYVKTEDLNDYITSSELEGRLADIVIPENVSAFNNDAGYITEQALEGFAKIEDLLEYLTEEDLEGYVKAEALEDYIPKSELEELASKSDLEGYVKKEDAIDYLTSSDLEGYVKVEDLEEYATKEDLDGYVRVEDTVDYATTEDLEDYLKISELPTDVSAFNNDAGYLTENDLPDFLKESDIEDYVRKEDLEDYIPKSELEELASKSDLEGYIRVEDTLNFLTQDDLVEYVAAGSFPADSDIDDEEAELNGYATVQDVMDYVNALLEKKKADEDSIRYAYITGYPLNTEPTNISLFNRFLLNPEGDTEIEIMTSQEMAVWDPSTNEDLPSLKLTVDIPEEFTLSAVYIWSSISNEYQLLEGRNAFGVNPRYSTRDINGITYNSYVRGPVDDLSTRGPQQYKIIVTK